MENQVVTGNSTKTEFSNDLRDVNEQLVIGAIHLQEVADTATQTEQRLRDLVESLNAIICEVNVNTGQATFLSLRSDTFLGRPVNLWRESPAFLTDIIHPSDRLRAASLIPEHMNNGQSYEYDFRALSGDQEWIYMRNIVRAVRKQTANVDLLRCVIVDVTNEKEIAEALELAYERERDITESLQRSILFMPAEDSFPGLTVNRLYEAASDESLVGGDFFDTFACGHGHVALVIGDVTGHGLPAAMFTAELKYAMRGFVREHVEPSRILSQMNSYLCEGFRLHREGLYKEGNESPLCIAVAIINTTTGDAFVASGGMEPPLIVRNDGTMEELLVGGMLLGIEGSTDYEQKAFHLEPGDSIVMTTDGVTEPRMRGNFLGYDGLMDLAHLGWSKGSLEEMGSTIMEGAREFGGGTLRDDACILLARRVQQ
jgi:serine phosphatase RsbU (regulator of sigma subunit)